MSDSHDLLGQNERRAIPASRLPPEIFTIPLNSSHFGLEFRSWDERPKIHRGTGGYIN